MMSTADVVQPGPPLLLRQAGLAKQTQATRARDPAGLWLV